MQTERTSPLFAAAFAAGCGGVATADGTLQPGPLALFGSIARWDILQQAIAEGRTWYYGDHAFFRRQLFYRIARNRYQHDGTGTHSPARFAALRLPLAPTWQPNGHTVIICPNSPRYMKSFGIDAHQWAVDLAAQLGTLSDRPVLIRWKSSAGARPLAQDLHTAHVVVVFSSASAVEALLHGVPCITLAPWASTAHMGSTTIADVEAPYRPDIGARDQFLFNLAGNQWTLDEMRSGLAWRMLQAEAERQGVMLPPEVASTSAGTPTS